jgi:nicotinamide mononucleotide transporter
MLPVFDTILAQLREWTPLEAAAVALAILYLLLAIRENIWCWACAAASTATYVYLCLHAKLYMEAMLNLYYFVMAVYGWRVWHSGHTSEHELPVAVWPMPAHAAALGAIVVGGAASGFLLATHTDAAFPYVDSLTALASIWATFLVARKVLENWWYWLVIDAVSVYMYFRRGLPLTSMLFMLYLAMIPFGLVAWTRSRREEATA